VISGETQFEVEMTIEDCWRFAELSGNLNSRHADAQYAQATEFDVSRPLGGI